MIKAIIELLNRADERKLKLVYNYTKALVGKDVEVIPVISITDADLRLSETALKYVTDEELEQVQAICSNIREREQETQNKPIE
jgi:hypothetical protein